MDHTSSLAPVDAHPGDAPVALITGGSAGLGRALVLALAADGWSVVTDARHSDPLLTVAEQAGSGVVAVAGDVAEPHHRERLVGAVGSLGRLDLLVNNASTLGPTPLPALADADSGALEGVWRVNVEAPLALSVALLPRLRSSGGALVSITSDASVEHYQGWGLYAASKAALDHLTITLGAENPEVAAYAVDPGDLRTAMHQAAFPGEDISDRPWPETVVAPLLRLLWQRPASGRYRAADFAEPTDTPAAPAAGIGVTA